MAEYEGSAAADALWAAITDEPLPEGAHDDPEFLAEHRSATADVALLREQLGLIGAALAEDETSVTAGTGEGTQTRPSAVSPSASASPSSSLPSPRARGTRRPPGAAKRRTRHPGALAVTLGTLAATAVATLVVGMGWLLAQGGDGAMGASDSSGAKAVSSGSPDGSANASTGASTGAGDSTGDSASLSAPGYLACTRLVAEGTVAEVEQVPGTGQDRITLDVDRYYKPDKGKAEIAFVTDADADPRLHRGDHVLIGIPLHGESAVVQAVGEKDIARERAWITEALPASRGLRCEESG